ncbi:MAG: hypothetical protein AB7G88_11980, partial [Thermomicrobiales bacterium]
YTWAPTVEEWRRQIDKQAETIHQQWGTLEAAAGFLNVLAPSGKDDPELQRWVAQLHRDGASPGAAIALHRMNLHLDVRAVLPNISAPALVLHRSGDRMCSIQGGRYLAEHIPNATLTQLDGEDHLPWIGNGDSVVEAIRSFVTGMGGDRSRGGLAESGVVTILVMRSSPLPESETGSECLRGHMEQSIAMFHGRAFEAGDGSFVVTFEGPMAAIHCAAALLTDSEAEDLGVRIGIHTGETGVRDSSGRGMAYVVAEKLAEMASPGEVLVSPAVWDLVAGSGLEFANRGTLCVDPLPEQWHAFAAVSNGTGATP